MKTAEGEQSWTVRESCYNHDARASAELCGACKNKKEYDLVGALNHIHARHPRGQSRTHEIPPRPHEDPCIVWLQNTKVVDRDVLFNDLADYLVMFNGDLERLLQVSRELHLFLARPRTAVREMGCEPEKAEGEKQPPGQTNGATAGGGKHDDGTPTLPTSLLRAFESIVALFAVQARIVLLTVREENVKKTRSRNNRASKGKRRYLVTLEAAMLYLEEAREDLIVGITSENSNAVRLGAVGAEYIVAMAMANVQSGAFRIGAGSSRAPPDFPRTGRRAVTWMQDPSPQGAGTRDPARKASPPATSLDIVAFYAAHLRALDLGASLRPQRRAFLAIRKLEEELTAVKDHKATQWCCLENSRRVSDPASFRVTGPERTARFQLERKVLERAKSDVWREYSELGSLLHRAGDLRARVKESIEVLDEGHGNAIRVFTLVTLSFVTSFFGMNTADVRDMPQGSWLYWAIAAPITLSVLGSAYLYAYSWEDLTRRVSRKTWLDQGVVTSPAEARPEQVGARRPHVVGRFGLGRGRKHSTMDSYGNRGWRDTWGMTRGGTTNDAP
ncbi:hypothetical protein LX36DRAFT_675535 [Colletotrichum falcatum]|nr:hypothetical protein LX36DRAFT_675535 [Colletotrichum falcatum]